MNEEMLIEEMFKLLDMDFPQFLDLSEDLSKSKTFLDSLVSKMYDENLPISEEKGNPFGYLAEYSVGFHNTNNMKIICSYNDSMDISEKTCILYPYYAAYLIEKYGLVLNGKVQNFIIEFSGNNFESLMERINLNEDNIIILDTDENAEKYNMLAENFTFHSYNNMPKEGDAKTWIRFFITRIIETLKSAF